MADEKKASRATLISLLREVYERDGPRNRGGVVPPAEYAAMKPEEIEQWDFDARHQMHRIAKAISVA